MNVNSRSNWHTSTAHLSMCLTLFLTPMWLRLPDTLHVLPDIPVTRFAMLIPMLLALVFSVGTALRGINKFLRSALHMSWLSTLILLTVWAIFSQSWAMMSTFPPDSANFRPEVARNAVQQLIAAIIFVIIVALNPPSLRWIIVTLSISLFANSIITITQAVIQHDIGLSMFGEFEFAVDQTGKSILTAGDLRWIRPYGLMPHPNHIGGYLAATWFASGVWLLSSKNLSRWLGTLLAAIGLYALLLTFSRGAWIGFAATIPALIIPLWQWLKRNKQVLNHFLLTIALLILTAGAFVIQYRPLVIARAAPLTGTPTTMDAVNAGEIQSTESRSLSDRRIFTELALRSIRENPLLGVGIGNTPWKISQYLMETDYDLRANYVHNTYLAVLADLGGIGLLLFLMALGIGLYTAIQKYWQQPTTDRLALIALVLSLAVTGFFDYYQWALIQFQVLWWGCLAAAMSDEHPLENASE